MKNDDHVLRFGLLGCGRIGHVHARSLKGMPRAVASAVADVDSEAAVKLAKFVEADVRPTDDIISSDDVDAVVIGTPTDLHYEQIHAAAAAGKAIFCEKPIDLSADRTRECIAAVDRAGVPFMVGFNRRFDPNFAALEARLRAGEIGRIELVTILSRDPGPPPIDYVRRSGGLFRDMMIHDFDLARFLLGEEPATVHAVGSCLVDPAIGEAGDIDTAAVLLTTGSGAICQISNSRRATYGYDQRIEVHGAGGMLRADNVFESTVEAATDAGFRRSPVQHFFLERYETAYRLELENFASAVLDGRPVTPDGRQGLRAQMIADAAQRSLGTGQPQAIDAAG